MEYHVLQNLYESLKQLWFTQSFSRKGFPCDNAVIESFFNILKREDLHRRVYRSERDFLQRLDEFILFYNSNRPHRYNGLKTPDCTEKMFEKSMDLGKWQKMSRAQITYFSNINSHF